MSGKRKTMQHTEEKKQTEARRPDRRTVLIWIAVVLFAAAQAVGLFFLIRVRPATSLTLSESAITLKLDEGRQITHTIEPASARERLLAYSVSWSEEPIAWIDDKNEMIVAMSPGTCTIRARLDGQEATVDVTVTPETVMAGNWAGDGAALSLGSDLAGRLDIGNGETEFYWMRSAFNEGENSNPYRYVKLTGVRDGVKLTLYYDRLNDTMRLHTDGAPTSEDRILLRK